MTLQTFDPKEQVPAYRTAHADGCDTAPGHRSR